MSRITRITSIVLVCMVAAAAALAVLPARWLLRFQPDDALVTLVDADGTLWNGRGWVALGAPGQRRMLTEPLSWQWQGLGLQVRHAWMRAPVQITVGWMGVGVSAGQIQLPAGALAGLGTPWNIINPGGQLALQWQKYDPAAPRAGALAQANWQDASSALSPLSPLGSYRLSFNRADDGIAIKLDTLDGALSFTGEGQLEKGRFQFRGVAKPSEKATDAERASLQGLLYALDASPSRNGDYRFGMKD